MSENEVEDLDSGPYCRHFLDPSDCELFCLNENCRHRCSMHSLETGECIFSRENCDCKEYLDPEKKEDKTEEDFLKFRESEERLKEPEKKIRERK